MVLYYRILETDTSKRNLQIMGELLGERKHRLENGKSKTERKSGNERQHYHDEISGTWK